MENPPGQLLELAGHRRVRHHGERQRHQLGLGRAALRRRPGRAVQRDHRPRRHPGLPRLVLPVGLPHLPLRVGPGVSPQQLRWYVDGAAVPHRQPGQVDARLGADDQPRRLLPAAQRGHGRRVPERVAGGATPTAATVSGSADVVDYVAVYQSGGGTTAHAAAADARRPAAAGRLRARSRPSVPRAERDVTWRHD